MDIALQLENIRKKLPPQVTLVAVSKFQPLEYILSAYEAGQRDFGENRPQEFAQKVSQMPQDVRWHFIGHLQTNKVKLVVGKAVLIHSVDSLRLLQAIQNRAQALSVVQPVLLQVHLAEEETKTGFLPSELQACLQNKEIRVDLFPNLRFCGLMTIASLTADSERIKSEFLQCKALLENIKAKYFAQVPEFKELSMGMTGDYAIALDCGSTIVRLGSAIFPRRPAVPAR